MTLEQLEMVISSRLEADATTSYTKSLFDKGINHCAKKFGEETVEMLIASLTENDDALIGECADVLYHMLVLLRIRGIDVQAIMNELAQRTQQSGLEEKAARPQP